MFEPDVVTVLEDMMKSIKRILLSEMRNEYKKWTGKSISFTGKLKKSLEAIPNIKVDDQDYVLWVVSESTIVKREKCTKFSPSLIVLDRIVEEDDTARIFTFEEAVSRKVSYGSTIYNMNDVVTGQTTITAEEMAKALFSPAINDLKLDCEEGQGIYLCNQKVANQLEECALLGHLQDEPLPTYKDPVFLNTHEPFVLATIGVQGAGKSHTTSCVLESCLIPFEPGSIVKLKAPMMSLVLHYDQNTTSICESAGLLIANTEIFQQMMKTGVKSNHVPKSNAVIMVSPTFYRQRKAFYGDHVIVKPLLFKWRSLTADHIKRIMRIKDTDNQLYVASFMDILRNHQRRAVMPTFPDFLEELRQVCTVKGQQGPLDQRIAILESMVAESNKNTDLKGEGIDLGTCCSENYFLIIADLTDPLLSKDEANGIFQVLTEQFRALPIEVGKVLCLDEAHKFMDGVKSDGLSEALVNVARLMRHDGMRLVVSTQSPKALAPELLELVTVACIHHFHSPDWWVYLKSKLALSNKVWECILSLRPGNAIAFATRHNLEGSNYFPIRVRPRITADFGGSKRNSSM